MPTFAEFMQDDKTLLIKSSTSINDLHVNLYNAVGTAVLSGDYDVAASRPLKLNLSPFKPGAYFGRISSASGLRYFHFEVLSR